MILYIHGFASCGWGEKSLALRRFFGVHRVIAPDLPFEPSGAVERLEQLLARYPISALAGASLGGFYATWLNRQRHLPAVLINPVVRPHEKLAAHTGTNLRWCDAMSFDMSPDWLTTLSAMQRPVTRDEERYLVLLQKGDEVLDYREALTFYRNQSIELEDGGDHRFAGFTDHLERISGWLGIQPAIQHAEIR
jgi:predicted esterase YcpF (UPF0227 family)